MSIHGMQWLVIAMGGLSVFMLIYALFHYIFLSNRRLERRMKKYLELNDSRRLNPRKFNILLQMQLYKQSLKTQVVSKKKGGQLEVALSQAGWAIGPEEYILFRWIGASVGGGLLFVATGSWLALLLGLIVGGVTPRLMLKHKQKERLRRFNDGLQDMITTVIGSLRVGFSFSQALKTVVDEADPPMKEEMETVLKEMQYGSSMEDALHALKERMPSEDLDLLIQAILIQRQVGGNLATILETIVQTIRDRNKIQRQIQTLTAQGRLSGVVIGLLPIVIGILLYLIEPDYIGTLVSHPLGWAMLAAGCFSGLIGFVFIRKITTIEV